MLDPVERARLRALPLLMGDYKAQGGVLYWATTAEKAAQARPKTATA